MSGRRIGPGRLPDFILIGAAKSGTTSLYSCLCHHPQIISAAVKEVHFFDENFHRGIAWYRSQFPSLLTKYDIRRRRVVLTFESSPYYIFHPHAPRRMARLIPKVRLLALFRNPVDRAYSHYHHQVRLGNETLSFESAIDCESERIERETEKMLRDENYMSFNHRAFSYLARGIYIDQLRSWFSFFPREQMLILQSENLYANPTGALAQTYAFLGLPPKAFENFWQSNKGNYPPMSDQTRKRLLEYFAPYNQELYKYLGVDWQWDR